jgi:DNA-binding winged helix-turn-helix (wHTH) protein
MTSVKQQEWLLKLTGQPFQVLAILLERPGEVVAREELQKRQWPDTTSKVANRTIPGERITSFTEFASMAPV